MKKRRIICLFLALLFVLAPMANAVEETGSETENNAQDTNRPKIVVEGANIGKTGYFEVSLYVTAAQFQTVGVVLSYDTKVIRPVKWTDKDNELSLGGDWSSANAAVPTIGAAVHTETAPRSVSGKPALAFEITEDLADDFGRGYLYLGAEALRFEDLSEERVVTVRFQYAEGKNIDDVTMPTTVARAGNTMTLCLAPTYIARDAIPHTQALLTTGNTSGIELDFYTFKAEDDTNQDDDDDDANLIDEGDKECDLEFRRIVNGKTANTGGGGGGGFAITFFDWDGRVIDAISAEQNATDAVKLWMDRQVIDERLTNKPGYKFDQWLVVVENNDGEGLHTKGGTFTSNNTPLAAGNGDVADFSDLTKYADVENGAYSVLVQAAYFAKEDINTGVAGAAAAYYTVKPISYTRYGGATANDGKYSITLEVTRLNSADRGVTRARTPGVVVKMQPTAAGSEPIFTLLSLENTDVTTCEVVPNKQISSVEYYFIDAATSPGNWPGAGNLSPLNVKINKDNDTGFIRLGTIGYINQMARDMTAAEFAAAIDQQTFTDAGLSYSGPGIALARTRMYNAVRASSTDLNKTQLQTAIGSSAYN